MFKRVAKRLKRQREDEELGLDATAKEVLGLHDTDSDESSSSSSDSNQSDDENVALEDQASLNGDDEDVEEEDGDELENMDADVNESDADEPPISVAEALDNPLYIASLEPEVKACISCPGKLLKNSTMEEVHRSSNAHVRRYKHFMQIANELGADSNVRDIVKRLATSADKQTPSNHNEPSKRALKRQKKQVIIKAKRQKQKTLKAKGIAGKKAKAAVSKPEPDKDPRESPEKQSVTSVGVHKNKQPETPRALAAVSRVTGDEQAPSRTEPLKKSAQTEGSVITQKRKRPSEDIGKSAQKMPRPKAKTKVRQPDASKLAKGIKEERVASERSSEVKRKRRRKDLT